MFAYQLKRDHRDDSLQGQMKELPFRTTVYSQSKVVLKSISEIDLGEGVTVVARKSGWGSWGGLYILVSRTKVICVSSLSFTSFPPSLFPFLVLRE